MKKTIITLFIGVALSVMTSCSKNETETCTWSNSSLAGKTYLTTKVSGGTGSTTDSLGVFFKYTFTKDSIKSESLYRTPNVTSTSAYTASTTSNVNYLTVNGISTVINNFSCSGFSFSSSGNEPFNITVTKQ